MGGVIRRALAHVSPEELLLIPLVIIVALAILAQPTSITRLFDTPFATPIPGDSPADVFMSGRTPTPAPSPITVEESQLETMREALAQAREAGTILAARAATAGSLQCPGGSTLRESPVRYQDGSMDALRTCVSPDGSIVLWDTTSTRLRVIPGSISRP